MGLLKCLIWVRGLGVVCEMRVLRVINFCVCQNIFTNVSIFYLAGVIDNREMEPIEDFSEKND